MSDQEEKLVQFTSITGAPEDRAKFYLESSAWQVEVAMARYYENDGDDVEEVIEASAAANPVEEPLTSDKPYKPNPRSTNVFTLDALNTVSSDEEEEGEAYYAGGSERSGQQVLGPPKKKKDIVADMFKSVQEHGVEVVDPSAATTSRSFRGTGYKLGQDEDDSEVIPGPIEQPPPSEVTLRLWQNGFTVNDGELRLYNLAANKTFLDSVRRGEIPQELKQDNTEVHLAMEDHHMEMHHQISRRVRPFYGQGYTLGSPAPTVVTGAAAKVEDKPANEAAAKESLQVDASQPTTNLQIRLADGSRLVGQFNQSHTIASVRAFIAAARPQYQSQAFNLLTSYPSKMLADDSQTLLEAGLLNAAIMQKLV